MANTPPTTPDQTNGNYISFLLAGTQHTGPNGNPVAWGINAALLPLYIANDTDTDALLETAVALGITFPLTFVGIGLELALDAIGDSGNTTGQLIEDAMQTDADPLIAYLILLGITTPLAIGVIPVSIALKALGDNGPLIEDLMSTDPYEYLEFAIQTGILFPLSIAAPIVQNALEVTFNSGKTLNSIYQQAASFLVTQDELVSIYESYYSDAVTIANNYLDFSETFFPDQSELNNQVASALAQATELYQGSVEQSESFAQMLGDILPSQSTLESAIESYQEDLEAIQEGGLEQLSQGFPDFEIIQDELSLIEGGSGLVSEGLLEQAISEADFDDLALMAEEQISSIGVQITESIESADFIDKLSEEGFSQDTLESEIIALEESFANQIAQLQQDIGNGESEGPDPMDLSSDLAEFATIILEQVRGQDIDIQELLNADVLQYAANSQIGFVSQIATVANDQIDFTAQYLDSLTPLVTDPVFALVNETALADFFTPEEESPVFSPMLEG